MLQKYINYLKDNPEGYWFKRKLYGWGWTPATWQGWLILAIYLVLVFIFSLTVNKSSPTKEIVFTFILPVLWLTATLLRICYTKGEKPRWQWGSSRKK
jgi:hypothetical protein